LLKGNALVLEAGKVCDAGEYVPGVNRNLEATGTFVVGVSPHVVTTPPTGTGPVAGIDITTLNWYYFSLIASNPVHIFGPVSTSNLFSDYI
jgi:hypothetical protein